MPFSQFQQAGKPEDVINALYGASMEFCRAQEPAYRDALTKDLKAGGFGRARLKNAFDQEIQVYEPPVFHNPIRRGEIEFFSMMSTLWLYHLYQCMDGGTASEITRQYMTCVRAAEPEWLGIFDYKAIKDDSYQSMRANRMTFYLQCIEEVAPVVLGKQSLDPLYDHFTHRLMAHLGFNTWELPQDLPDSRLFLFGCSDVWQEIIRQEEG